jgi:site-specific DNA recombinase
MSEGPAGGRSLVERLNCVDRELKEMQGKRADLVVPEVELPEDLPELYRAMVADLAAALSDESVAGRAADELHELVDRVVVHWDAEARGHWLSIEGSLLEMLRKSAPSKLDAVRGDIFAEVGCGSRI